MNPWLHLGQGILLGCFLGLLYDFLRPFRPRGLADLLFILSLFWIWIYLIFGHCGGDPRMAYSLSLLAGILLWEHLFGNIFAPAFSYFWKLFFSILRYIFHLPKNFLKKGWIFLNFLFASSKKWVTIKCNNPPTQVENRRNTHGIP